MSTNIGQTALWADAVTLIDWQAQATLSLSLLPTGRCIPLHDLYGHIKAVAHDVLRLTPAGVHGS